MSPPPSRRYRFGCSRTFAAPSCLSALLDRSKPGSVSLYSVGYLRHWFSAYLLENSKTILMPVYATVYMPGLLRAFGAKIGRDVEISTVSHICPDVLEVGEGSFLADACLVGGQRIHNSLAEIAPVRIGSKTFVGNSALVAGGHTLGNGVLIGAASTPPANTGPIPDNTRWLGAPGFALPNTQKDSCFAEATIFKPTILARLERAVTDAVRIILPGLVGMVCAVAFVAGLVICLPHATDYICHCGRPPFGSRSRIRIDLHHGSIQDHAHGAS